MACHRMTWMRAPTFTFFHDLSAVYTGAFKESPSAKQALSPKDKPSGRVCATRSPTSLACCEGKRNDLPDGAQCRFPRIVRAEAPADKFAVHFGQIDGADGRGTQSSGVNLSAPGS